MPLAPWLRALNAVGTVAEATRMFRSTGPPSRSPGAPVARDASDLERGLANVVVAALREAFDRDRARFELERDERDAVRAQAERGLRLERLRQVGMQAVSQVRMLAVFSVALWVASAAAAGFPRPAGDHLDHGRRLGVTRRRVGDVVRGPQPADRVDRLRTGSRVSIGATLDDGADHPALARAGRLCL